MPFVAHSALHALTASVCAWQKRIAAAQSRLKKLEKEMERRNPLPRKPPPPPPQPPQPPVLVAVHEAELPRSQPQGFTVDAETQQKVERIKALARAQPGASPLTIMSALA